jgi:hypothetical protein
MLLQMSVSLYALVQRRESPGPGLINEKAFIISHLSAEFAVRASRQDRSCR